MLLGGLSIAALTIAVPMAHAATPDTENNGISAAGKQTGAEEVLVTGKQHARPGGGLQVISLAVKQVETVSREYILTQLGTTNPIRLLSLQPGAVVASPDPFGLQPGLITVRGLNNNEIGWIFEGSPLNDGTLYPNEVVDAPNLEQVSLVPGSSDFDLPSSGAAGGAVQILMHDPQHTPGGQINLSYGSYHTHDEYIRLDSGDIANTGLRGFISYSHVEGNDWRSPGQNYRTHVDAKLIKEWSADSQTALSIAWNDINFQVERAPTLSQWKQYRTRFNYDSVFTKGDTNFYKLHQNPYRDVYATMPSTVLLADGLTLYSDPYVYYGSGIIPGGTNLSPTSTYIGTQRQYGVDLVVNGNSSIKNGELAYSPTIPTLTREGVNTNLRWDATTHDQFEIGYWFEYNERQNIAQYSQVNTSGEPYDIWGATAVVRLSNGKAYQYTNYLVRSLTNDIYVGDRMKYLDGRLAIDVGVKGLMYTQNAYNRIPGVKYNVNYNAFEVMPSLGVRYSIDDRQQVFMDAGLNSKMPDPSQLTDAVSPTTGKFTTRAGNAQKPELSIVEELGYRYTGPLIVGSATFFNYNFTNKQISTIAIQSGAMVTSYVNAGGQTSRGVDVSFGTRPIYNFRPFVSGEYLHATFDNNIARNGDYLLTAGKAAVNAPNWTGNLGINYDDGKLFGMFQMHFVSSQYSTFINDEKMKSYLTSDVTLGYRLGNISYVKHPTFQLNLTNLDDHKYLTGVNSTQYNAKTVKGEYGTTIAGSSPTYLVGGGFAAVVGFSAGF